VLSARALGDVTVLHRAHTGVEDASVTVRCVVRAACLIRGCAQVGVVAVTDVVIDASSVCVYRAFSLPVCVVVGTLCHQRALAALRRCERLPRHAGELLCVLCARAVWHC
jgi:hypothetical protein